MIFSLNTYDKSDTIMYNIYQTYLKTPSHKYLPRNIGMSMTGVNQQQMNSQTNSQSNGLSGIITALDNTPQMRVGENDHPEYAWNRNSLQEMLTQIFFQSVRSDFASRYALMLTFRGWVTDVLTPAFYAGQTTIERRRDALAMALNGYKMIAQLRDAYDGKGECRLAYDMLNGWYEGVKAAAFNVQAGGAKSLADNLNDLATQTTVKMAMRFMFVDGEDNQYGSFKDFKYICQEFALINLASQEDSDASSINRKFVAKSVVRTAFKNKGETKPVTRYRAGKETFRFTPEIMAYLRYHPVISALASAYGTQIFQDFNKLTNGPGFTTASAVAASTANASSSSISLAGKWAPRASSELFAPLRTLLFNTVVPESQMWRETAQTDESKKKADIKIETVYRKRLSVINKALSTVQVKQCEKKWANIDFDKDMTSITLARQKKAFAKSGDDMDEDRKQCAKNFAAFMERVKQGTSTAKGKRIAITDFVKEALELFAEIGYGGYGTLARISEEEQARLINEKALLDKQWEDKGKDINSLEDFIAMVDVSGSMDCDDGYPMNTAIGLGIRIAEKSRLGNRVMTFSERPEWVNLEQTPSFTDRVLRVKQAPWGCNTNFYSALQLILEAATNANLSPEEVGKLTLVILSDMQMDYCISNSQQASLFNRIRQLFSETGTKVCGTPYPVPKIVFWNLRRTDGFPSTSTNENAIMVSGGSDAILNDLCENGNSWLEHINPWNAFMKILNKPRYASLNTAFSEWEV